LDDYSRDYGPTITSFLQTVQRALDGPPVRVVIEHGLPAHSGFGSKTTTLLALGKAYARLCGKPIETGEVARIGGRAGTSGASVNLFDHGGFVIDGGHRNPSDFADDPRRYLVPSRFAGVGRKPPLLTRLPFPPWPLLMVLPSGAGLSGTAELEWFQRTLPIPVVEAQKAAHIVLMRLAPAIAEEDYEGFCGAIRALTYDAHFKLAQISTQSDALKRVLAEARDRSDIDAIGMSSMGPTCFAFTRDAPSAIRWLERLRDEGVIRAIWFTTAQNHSAEIEGVFAEPKEAWAHGKQLTDMAASQVLPGV
jgi:beta-ribofuranosylaminobenzene 5'-phosphate synthase